MKKFVAVMSAAAMIASLTACGSADSTAVSSAPAASSEAAEPAAKSYRIAVVQQLDHASLDQIQIGRAHV